MKAIFSIFITLFLITIYGMAQDTLYVYKSGNLLYKRAVSSVDSINFTYTPQTGTVSDNDQHIYNWRKIGTQTWMTENLKTTKYRNGESISNVIDGTSWSTASFGAWCDYNNNTANGTKYGHLYNWYAATDPRNIAPIGWHVATDADWTTLENYINSLPGTSTTQAKAMASVTDWNTSSVTGAIGNNLSLNNSSGFNGLPAGYRGDNGSFYSINITGIWWSSTESDPTHVYLRSLVNTNSTSTRVTNGMKAGGTPVRCVKD